MARRRERKRQMDQARLVYYRAKMDLNFTKDCLSSKKRKDRGLYSQADLSAKEALVRSMEEEFSKTFGESI